MKLIKQLVIFFTVLICLGMTVSAEEAKSADELIEGFLSEYDATDAVEGIENADSGILEGLRPDNLEELTFSSVVSWILSLFFAAFKKEAVFLSLMIGVIILSMLFEGVKADWCSDELKEILNFAVMSILLILISKEVVDLCKSAEATINSIGTFAAALAPITAGLLATSGQPAASVLSNSAIFAACELIAYLSVSVIAPVVNMYFALVVARSVTSNVNIEAICSFFKKLVSFISIALFTVFSGIMSVQSIIAMTNDSVAKQGIKTAAISIMPYAGNILGGAVETLFACAGTAKSLTGIFGIVVVIALSVTPLTAIFIKYITLKIGAFIAELSGNDRVRNMLNDSAGGFTLLMILTISAVAVVVACLTITVMLGKS